eukprot:120237-Ditylum_brightwellii.AAC.1
MAESCGTEKFGHGGRFPFHTDGHKAIIGGVLGEAWFTKPACGGQREGKREMYNKKEFQDNLVHSNVPEGPP